MVHVGREEGVAGLWSGVCSSLILTINPAIQFMVYEAMKRQMQKVYEARQLSSFVVFGVGAVAKTVATVLTYPIQLVQAKQRVSYFNVSVLPFLSSIMHTFKKPSHCMPVLN